MANMQLSLGLDICTYRNYYINVLKDIKNRENKIKIDFADKVLVSEKDISFIQFAKHLNDSGFNIGRNRLFKLLRTKKILMSNNIPYQSYIDRGYFTTTEKIVLIKWNYQNIPVTHITPKGQIWLVNQINKWKGN